MYKCLFTFDVTKAPLLLMLTHGIVANRLALTGAIPAGDYLQWCNLDGKIKVRKVRNSFSPNSALLPAGGLA